MYALGNYQQALCRIESDGHGDPRRKRTADLHLVRTPSRNLEIRYGRDGSPVIGVYLEDDGSLAVIVFDENGEASAPLYVPQRKKGCL